MVYRMHVLGDINCRASWVADCMGLVLADGTCMGLHMKSFEAKSMCDGTILKTSILYAFAAGYCSIQFDLTLHEHVAARPLLTAGV